MEFCQRICVEDCFQWWCETGNGKWRMENGEWKSSKCQLTMPPHLPRHYRYHFLKPNSVSLSLSLSLFCYLLAPSLFSLLLPVCAMASLPVKASTSPLTNSLVLPRPYLFIHIPKSGGTSVGRVAELEENGGGDRRFIRYWHHPVRPEVIKEMVQHDFVFGHFKFGVHGHFKDPGHTYMTILRDPVDRVISHYYYHLNSKDDRFHQLAGKRGYLDSFSFVFKFSISPL